MSTVAVLRTNPATVLDDYEKLMHLAGYKDYLPSQNDTLLKLNLSWTKFFPACSTAPWQLEGVIRTMLHDGWDTTKLIPVENKTVVTNPRLGAKNNKWIPVLNKYGLKFVPLTDVEWTKYEFKTPLLMLDKIFPKGIEIPKMFIGKNVLHLPTVKTHGHSITTGAIKNAFGGLLKEVRHYAHKYIHEVLVDLLIMQKELHPGVFAVMDGTVCGDGAGPRTMEPKIQNFILASGDSVAIDAIAAKMMGFEPMEIPYIRMATEMGLGCGNPSEIKVVGEDISGVNFGFRTKKSLVILGDQIIRKGWLQPLEKLLLHSPLVFWAPLASTIYHDWYWYPTKGKKAIREFMETGWGKLFASYS
ncbi:MAG: DUF362 domain-containing protein [Armatimonadetes bacterium]|nr:DUF362 domain-containing protein [Armatimonadota bacterium]